MTYEELQRKHLDELADLDKAKEIAWEKLRERHDAIKAAFCNKESEIPKSTQKQMQAERDEFSREWGHNGTQRKALLKTQMAEKLNLNSHRLNEFLKGQEKQLQDKINDHSRKRDHDRDREK